MVGFDHRERSDLRISGQYIPWDYNARGVMMIPTRHNLMGGMRKGCRVIPTWHSYRGVHKGLSHVIGGGRGLICVAATGSCQQ